MKNTQQSLLPNQVRVTFKNVGQGDSIIIEWWEENILNVGIIDCKKVEGGKNPVIDHLRRIQSFRLCFIVFTHPHKDHYSGSIELMEYLINARITVGHFLTTFKFSPGSFKCFSQFAGESLDDFLKKLESFKRSGMVGLLSVRSHSQYGDQINLGPRLKLTFLAPSTAEIDLFEDPIIFNSDDGFGGTMAINLIATVIKLESENKFILFTSDAQKQAFDTLRSESKSYAFPKLALIQIPHHGSVKNHQPYFWKQLKKFHFKNIPAVVSVGSNQWGHPHESVLQNIYDNGFKPACTNMVNGAISFENNLTEEEKERMMEMDHISRVVENFEDLEFIIDDFF